VFTELKEEIKGLNISSENGVIFLLTNIEINLFTIKNGELILSW